MRVKKRRRGSTTITMIGIAGAIVIFALFFLELLEMYDYQYAIEVRAQRAINSTVEYAMDDTWRSDGYNYMDVPLAQSVLYNYLKDDLNVDSSGCCYGEDGKLLYKVTYSSPTFNDGHAVNNSAGIQMKITVNMTAGLGKAFGKNGYTWTNTYASKNFRTDDNERAGWIWN